MAKILVVSMPFAGHVGPTSAIAAELIRRGHEVTAYTGAKYHRRFTSLGATWLPWTRATDYDDADLAATFPPAVVARGLRGDQANVKYILFGTAPGQAADILAAAAAPAAPQSGIEQGGVEQGGVEQGGVEQSGIEQGGGRPEQDGAAARGPFDLIVTDQLAFGGAVAAESLGIPWATVVVTPLELTSRHLPPPSMPWRPGTGPAGRARDAVLRGLTSLATRAGVDPQLNRLRAGVGLGPVRPGRLFDSVHSTDLVLAQGVPGLEYPRPDLPAHVHFVGRLAPAVAASSNPELPPWWPDLAAVGTVVHVTQGTLDVEANDLIKPTIAALADRDVLVVATTGGVDPATLGPLPPNARAAAFLPHDQLLPQVDVMVTNGGWGGVLAAVQAGIPLVVAGRSLDKPEVARRVAWSGAGLDLRTGSPKPEQVARAVDEIRADPRFRERARDLGAAITAAGGATRAGDLLERLLKL